MRRYDDPVDVRRGPVPGCAGDGPEQFLWRGRLWKVRSVVAHWVESTPWWQSEAVLTTIGSDGSRPSARPVSSGAGTELERWRVRAGWRLGGVAEAGGVFDLAFDRADGSWQLVGCED